MGGGGVTIYIYIYRYVYEYRQKDTELKHIYICTQPNYIMNIHIHTYIGA